MEILRGILERLRWQLVLYWTILFASLWVFTESIDQIYEQDGFFFDDAILNWFYSIMSPFLTRYMLVFSTIGGLGVVIALSLGISIFLWFKNRREAMFFAFSMGGASLIMVLTKYVLARPRPELFPDVNLWHTASPSFPSGHATGSMAFYLSLMFISVHTKSRWRALTVLLGSLMILNISASRLYLQVHYPSDILAGLALGAFWVLGVEALYRYQHHKHNRQSRTVLLTLPTNVIEAYREQAREQNLKDDDVVANVLKNALLESET